ncbi:hypothetical protein BH11PLA2_BH11PLA2_50880 [soil metagenome]
MTAHRLTSLLFALVFTANVSSSLFASDAPAKDASKDATAKWDWTRTKPPATVEELKALQATLKAVVDKVTPSVVAIQYGAGAGSGVIVSDDGLVLTAAHVVTPMPAGLGGGGGGGRRGRTESDGLPPKNCTVMLPDGKELSAVVLGRNGSMDSAILKITAKVPKDAKWPGADKGKWPVVELGKSADLKLNQWVVALGHPGGPKKDRRPPVRLGQVDQISGNGSRVSTDCTLVGGDSGGPLFDLQGKLLGIHSSIGGDLTQNFHVPTKMYQRDWERLVRGDNMGSTSNALIGVVLNRDEKDGVVKPIIDEVNPKSAAEDAGLKPGDVITSFNGNKVKTSQDIDDIMTGLAGGQRVEIHVRRGDDTYELEITLGKRPKKAP